MLIDPASDQPPTLPVDALPCGFGVTLVEVGVGVSFAAGPAVGVVVDGCIHTQVRNQHNMFVIGQCCKTCNATAVGHERRQVHSLRADEGGRCNI